MNGNNRRVRSGLLKDEAHVERGKKSNKVIQNKSRPDWLLLLCDHPKWVTHSESLQNSPSASSNGLPIEACAQVISAGKHAVWESKWVTHTDEWVWQAWQLTTQMRRYLPKIDVMAAALLKALFLYATPVPSRINLAACLSQTERACVLWQGRAASARH